MTEIPQNCIDTFKERFGSYPSIVGLYPSMSKEDTDKFLSKAHLLWYEDFVNVDYDIIKFNGLLTFN